MCYVLDPVTIRLAWSVELIFVLLDHDSPMVREGSESSLQLYCIRMQNAMQAATCAKTVVQKTLVVAAVVRLKRACR